jgi:hypothetical protein
MNSRPLCQVCQSKPRAVAYHKYDRVYYRTRCNACIRRDKKIKPAKPRWQTAGYKKKPTCDRCGFRGRHHTQLTVYHVNGNLNDCATLNLKTVCLNCVVDRVRSELPWRSGDLEPDH